ncbi:MAG: marine proteobacterial sortase target protein [Hyphomicrobiales bacterium]|nr:marine proteobacterial sortase target protein [Hyphomicrobiales bacterium]
MKPLHFDHPMTRLRACAALIALAATAFHAIAASAQAAPLRFSTPHETRGGALVFESTVEGRHVEAPLLGADIDMEVTGAIVRARVTQRFRNPASGWVEGVYLFPLPEDAAVDTLKMVIGERIVVGQVKERQAAKIIYEQAKADGKKAGLIEQERPNMFTTSVANIGPGETVVIQFEYQHAVRQSGGEFSLRAPLVVAPRYTPPPVMQTVEFTPGGGWADPVPDRERISSPVLDPARHAPANPVTLTVRLNAGFAIGEIKSPHHEVRIDEAGEDRRVVSLTRAVAADRDFELVWTPKSGLAPSAGLFRERAAGREYILAMLAPPAATPTPDRRPREAIFVIDNSGSMGGESMRQAKASLLFALDRLQPEDSFNIVRFDDTMETLFPVAVKADARAVGEARAFVRRLEANGGTEMVPAMAAALRDGGAVAGDVRQVVFLTDGAIGNEQQLFETVAAQLGRSRVFMVGIGSAPNSHLMTRAAELGRGAFVHIGSPEQVEERMRELFGKLEAPAVTNLQAQFTGAKADMTPARLPDLYRGEALTFAAEVDALKGEVVIEGLIGDQPWRATLSLDQAAEGAGIAKLWARRKISDAEVERTLGAISPDEADAHILALSLNHQIVSRRASLVAVDATPTRPHGERLTRADVPLNLPAGWDFEKVFGPQGEDGPALEEEDRQVGRFIRASATAAAPAAHSMSVRLPKTATPAQLLLIAGLLFIACALALAAFARSRR